VAITTELYFAGQGAGHIGWPLTAGAFRLFAAVLATACVFLAHVGLGFAFALVAAGSAGSGMISLIGFSRVSWAPRRP
jgi:hypothetical protein